jgi:hypothetical protein
MRPIRVPIILEPQDHRDEVRVGAVDREAQRLAQELVGVVLRFVFEREHAVAACDLRVVDDAPEDLLVTRSPVEERLENDAGNGPHDPEGKRHEDGRAHAAHHDEQGWRVEKDHESAAEEDGGEHESHPDQDADDRSVVHVFLRVGASAR